VSTKTKNGAILVAVAIPYPPAYPDGMRPSPAILTVAPLADAFNTKYISASAIYTDPDESPQTLNGDINDSDMENEVIRPVVAGITTIWLSIGI
jgi:hypothetical protein